MNASPTGMTVLDYKLLRLILVFVFGIYCSPLSAQGFDQKISRLINLGQIEAAHDALEASNPTEIARLFFAGQLLKASQRYLNAADVFRQIIRLDPHHINAKRELAHTLMLAGEIDEAERQFRDLYNADSNQIMREGYRRYLIAIDKNRPSDVNLQFALLPSSNINKGTDNTIFDSSLGEFVINPSLQGESGIGVQAGLSGYFRKQTSLQSQIQLDWGVSTTIYQNDIYNSVTGSGSLTYSRKASSGLWSVSPYVRSVWNEGSMVKNSIGIQYVLQKTLTSAGSLNFSLSHENRSYPLKSYQDGPFTSGSLSITHQVGNQLSFSGGIKSELSHPESEYLKYVGRKIFGTVTKIWNSGTYVQVGVQFGDRKFEGVYPLTATPRDDSYSGVSYQLIVTG